MSIAIDIIIVAIFLLFVIRFTMQGFARTVFKIGKTWLSLFTSIAIGPFISGRIREWFLSDTITKGIKNTLADIVANNPNEYNIGIMFESLPKPFISFLEHFNISLPALEMEYGTYTTATDEILDAIALRIATPCADLVAQIAGHIICFLITFFFFRWLNLKIRSTRVPFFRYADKVVGFVVGSAIGISAAVAFSMILYTVFQVIVVYDAHSPVASIYDNSYIFKFINQIDFVGMIKQFFASKA